MKNEAAAFLPFAGFGITGLLADRLVVKYNLRLYRSAKNLKKVYSDAGIAWEYQNDLTFRKTLFLNPNEILNSSDTEEIRKAKQDMINSRMEMKPVLIRGSLIMLVGFVCVVILAFAGYAIGGSI